MTFESPPEHKGGEKAVLSDEEGATAQCSLASRNGLALLAKSILPNPTKKAALNLTARSPLNTHDPAFRGLRLLQILDLPLRPTVYDSSATAVTMIIYKVRGLRRGRLRGIPHAALTRLYPSS
jgi:hypothetical protein